METTGPKSAIVDAIKKSTNILVTVSKNPPVDALSAAIGLSLILNKLDKHATAVFSGIVPHAIEFLEPGKRFEDNVSSLRDFIVALDKEKADRLRYKVEGDVVRIYITPYKTTITQRDLEFSEGDFNVDLVIALGVDDQSQLDSAITAHGKILHDATVATINCDANKVQLGSINWSDDKASSLSEMLMGLSEALQGNILDQQISTALLTGIVAATDRFSNKHTTPRVMTMSAQLMAAGANQQLIAEKLQQTEDITPSPALPRDGSTPLEEGESKAVADKLLAQPPASTTLPESPATVPHATADGEIHVHHDGTAIEQATEAAERIAEEASDDRREQANQHLEQDFSLEENQSPVPARSDDWRDQPDTSQAKSAHEPEPGNDLEDDDFVLPPPIMPIDEPSKPATDDQVDTEPSLPQFIPNDNPEPPTEAPFVPSLPVVPAESVTASNPQVVMDSRPDVALQEADNNGAVAFTTHDDHNDVSSRGKTLDPITMQPIKSPATPLPVLPSESAPPITPPVFSPFPTTPRVNDSGLDFEEAPLPGVAPDASAHSFEDLKAEVEAAAGISPSTSSLEDARSAVNNAFGTEPLSVGGQPSALQPVDASQPDLALPPPPPMPDFSAMPPMPPATPPMPETLAPHPAAPAASAGPAVPPAATAPNQFRIPGQ